MMRRAASFVALALAPAALALMGAMHGCAGEPRPRDSQPAPNPNQLGDALDFDPVISREPWSFRGANGVLITTPSYRIFTTETSQLLRRRIPAYLELAMIRYQQISGLGPPPRPLETYVLANRDQWVELTRLLTGPRAESYLRVRAGGFAEQGRALLFNFSAQGAFATASHEGWHQYTQTVLREPLPIWLEEGLATYMEGYKWNERALDQPVFLPWANIQRFDRLREIVNSGRLKPLDRLLDDRPQDLLASHDNALALDFYAQVWALALFLMEDESGDYAGGVREMLASAADGTLVQKLAQRRGRDAANAYIRTRAGADAFGAFFSEDLDEASRRYRAFIEQIIATGGRDAVAAGRSPLD